MKTLHVIYKVETYYPNDRFAEEFQIFRSVAELKVGLEEAEAFLENAVKQANIVRTEHHKAHQKYNDLTRGSHRNRTTEQLNAIQAALDDVLKTNDYISNYQSAFNMQIPEYGDEFVIMKKYVS